MAFNLQTTCKLCARTYFITFGYANQLLNKTQSMGFEILQMPYKEIKHFNGCFLKGFFTILVTISSFIDLFFNIINYVFIISGT